jgi:hypothetical protein
MYSAAEFVAAPSTRNDLLGGKKPVEERVANSL